MDHQPPKNEDFIDLESGTDDRTLDNSNFTKLCDQSTSVNENSVKSNINSPEKNVKIAIDSNLEVEKVGDFLGKKKPKKASSAKKPPKPPRPPRGFSLDASDQKLIKEITELAMMKKARIERMKALQHKKALKASSSSSISGSLFATIFTVIFFLMILLQGMSCKNPGVTTQAQDSPQTNENGLVFIQEQLNPSASDSVLPHSKSTNLFGKISVSRKISS